MLYRAGAEAAEAFSELARVLGQAPDPEPYLNAISPLQERVSDLQRENRRLQLHGQAAESEASSASQAVVRNRELERENAGLKAQLKEKVLIIATWKHAMLQAHGGLEASILLIYRYSCHR